MKEKIEYVLITFNVYIVIILGSYMICMHIWIWITSYLFFLEELILILITTVSFTNPFLSIFTRPIFFFLSWYQLLVRKWWFWLKLERFRSKGNEILDLNNFKWQFRNILNLQVKNIDDGVTDNKYKREEFDFFLFL